MPTPIELFDYVLPPERIAQEPVRPRDTSRLMVLDRATGERQHKRFFEIVDELRAGDLLVMNDTKVFKARLRGRRFAKELEVFLLRPVADALPGAAVWHALVRPGKLVHVGNNIQLADGVMATVVDKLSDGSVRLSFLMSNEEVIDFANRYGEIPVPPYVEKAPENFNDYQTVYARETGSVAAPTAGFHFTPELIEKLKGKGVQFSFVTLHVGIGTFRPVKTATLEEHEMHSEFVEISPETASTINIAKHEGRRVIAVGTTTVRALEGVASLCHPEEAKPTKDLVSDGREIPHFVRDDHALPPEGFVGDVNMFITPGYTFKIIDALITNFHLPKSTLLVLVSAFAGREKILAAYQEAVEQQYRFFSFGDAMFLR